MEWPVIMMLLEVTANAEQRLGTLIDLASDTMRQQVESISEMKTSHSWSLVIPSENVRTSQGTFRSHQLIGYGLDSITDVQMACES